MRENEMVSAEEAEVCGVSVDTLIDHRIACAHAEGAAWVEVYALRPEVYEARQPAPQEAPQGED